MTPDSKIQFLDQDTVQNKKKKVQSKWMTAVSAQLSPSSPSLGHVSHVPCPPFSRIPHPSSAKCFPPFQL